MKTIGMIRLLLVGLSLTAASAFSDQIFTDPTGREIRIVPVKAIDEIDLIQGKDVLVRGFMTVYEDVPLIELNSEFKSTGDVRRFYQNYFESELEHYKHGELIWVQAFEGEKLLGWATFQMEENKENAAYMNLLVIDPNEQRRGVGKYLTFSICSEDLYPQTQEINVLLRKINEDGRNFYENIGFVDFDYNRQDNFVDISLLTGLRWTKSQ
jgi:ribosomal protein S18 acetylase RimI-like enzyme